MEYFETENIFPVGNELRLSVVVHSDGLFWVDVVDKNGFIIGSSPMSNIDELTRNYE